MHLDLTLYLDLDPRVLAALVLAIRLWMGGRRRR